MASRQRLKILYLMYNGLLNPSGEQSLNFHRLRALEWAGARTWVASQEAPDDLRKDQIADARAEVANFAPSAEIQFYRRRAAWPRRMVGELLGLCRQEGIQLLVFTQVQNALAVRSLKRAVGVPALWDCRAGADARILVGGGPVRRLKNAAFRRAYGLAARLSDHMLVISEKHADHMARRFNYPKGRMTVAPNGTDTVVFRPDPEARAALREELGILPEQLVVIYCGSVQPWQCLPESLGLFGHLRAARPNAHLLMLTPDLDEGRALARGLLDENAYTVVSALHREVPRYLAAADIGLLLRRPTPRNAVASPTKFAEYMACALPTAIGPGVGDCTDLVQARSLGVVVDADAPETWESAAESLLALLEEGPDGAQARCRQTAVELLSTELQRERFLWAIQGAVRRPANLESADAS